MRVSGVVSGAHGPLEGITVTLYGHNADYGSWGWIADTTTDAQGSYTLPASAGDHHVLFSDDSGMYVDEYHADALDVLDATTVDVTDAGARVDASLEVAAHIRGRVTGPDGNGLALAHVSAWRIVTRNGIDHLRYVRGAMADSAGHYDLGGLAAGAYRIKVGNSSYAWPDIYATEWYDDKPSLLSAVEVEVTSGGVRTGIDAQVDLGSEISGKVVTPSGARIEEARVEVFVQVGGGWHHSDFAYTDEKGSYVIDGLAAGTYRVGFGAPQASGSAPISAYWKDSSTLSGATNVVLARKEAIAGIDATLEPGAGTVHPTPTVRNVTLPMTSGGLGVVGQELTVWTGVWSPEPQALGVQWMRDDEPIAGAIGTSYTPTASDVGRRISVVVTASASDHLPGTARSVPTAPVVAGLMTPSPPVVTPPALVPPPALAPQVALAAILREVKPTGAPRVGSTVRLTGLDASYRTAVTYRIQWFAGSKKIKKATKSKLKISRSLRGKKISVKVTATAAGTTVSKKLILGKAR